YAKVNGGLKNVLETGRAHTGRTRLWERSYIDEWVLSYPIKTPGPRRGCRREEKLLDACRVVHRGVGEAIGVGVLRAAHVLERDRADLVREQARPGVQGNQAGILDFVIAQHLLHEQQRIGSHVERPLAVMFRPLERGDQPAVLRDVVGGG